MTGTELSLVIGQLAVLVAALASAFVNVRNSRKLDQQGEKIGRVETKVATVHDLTKKVQEETNGMKTELVNEVRAASFAKGVKSEIDKAKST